MTPGRLSEVSRAHERRHDRAWNYLHSTCSNLKVALEERGAARRSAKRWKALAKRLRARLAGRAEQ